MYKFFKRLFDIIICLAAFPVFCLILLVVSISIKAEDGGPVFYKAERIGKDGKKILMYKFRSMKVNAPDIRNEDGSTYNAKDDVRVTKIGKFLRETSLDETAQILNVLKGDMALIGPRPLLPKYLTLYSKSSFAVMRFGQVLQVGPKSTVEIISPGQKHLNLMFGMLIIVH